MARLGYIHFDQAMNAMFSARNLQAIDDELSKGRKRFDGVCAVVHGFNFQES
jgi:hypothetical protein